MPDKINRNKLVNSLNHNRIYLFLAIILLGMPMLAPGFLKAGNMVPMLKSSVVFILAGIGFTYCMIGGNFDLSIGSMINVGAVISIGTFNSVFKMMNGHQGNASALLPSWAAGFLLAMLAGAFFGAINGLLVAKGKVHSFIVTIGMLTALSGFVYTYCNGNTISAIDYTLADLIDRSLFAKATTKMYPYLKVVTPRFITMIVLVILFEILLQQTRWGRNFFMTGSNKEVAWQAGINIDWMIIQSFIISGAMAALSGALFAISMNAAVPNYGERGISPLSIVLAATIIGGTAMTGGSGSVLKTAVAVMTIQGLFNGLIMMGAGFDLQVLAAGILLAAVVLFEAYSIYRQNQHKGERPTLMKEAVELRQLHKTNP